MQVNPKTDFFFSSFSVSLCSFCNHITQYKLVLGSYLSFC